MKFISVKLIPVLLLVLMAASCKKQAAEQFYKNVQEQRQIRFLLYTEKDFSNDNNTIVFTLSIEAGSGNILWDSVLAPMKIKDIPSFVNRLSINKLVPNNNQSLLKVGFRYAIENVGTSQFFDSSNAGESFKIVDFNFQ